MNEPLEDWTDFDPVKLAIDMHQVAYGYWRL